ERPLPIAYSGTANREVAHLGLSTNRIARYPLHILTPIKIPALNLLPDKEIVPSAKERLHLRDVEIEKSIPSPTPETTQKLEAKSKDPGGKDQGLKNSIDPTPTATNTFTKGIKNRSPTADDHRDITNYLTSKNLQYYVIEPPSNRPLKLVIKGLPADIDPEDIKNDLISKGIKIEKIAQLKKFTTKTPLPIFMIEARGRKCQRHLSVRSCSTCRLN
ncbi:uncharacterized protein TNIN_378401, partial [Trichonephila inaurata madagascariensis]